MKYTKENISFSAGAVLTEQENCDYYNAYLKLKKAQKKGKENYPALNFVNVWQPLETLSVGEIIELIEGTIIVKDIPKIEPFSDENPVTFTLAEVREITNSILIEYTNRVQKDINNLGICGGFWDYMKKSRFAKRIKKSAKN